MDFSSPDSDASSDSPINHNVSIRLSDIGKIDMYGNTKSARFGIDAQTQDNQTQLKAALRNIDGTPGHLEKAIDLEQRKSIFGKTSLIQSSKGKTKRPPPRPPLGKGPPAVGSEGQGDTAASIGRGFSHTQKENRAPSLPPRPHATTHVATRRALEFHPVDYTTIASPESIDTAR